MNMLLWGFLTDPIIPFYFMLRPRNVHGFSRITRQGGGTGFRSVFIHSFHFCQRSIFWAYKKCNQSNGKQSLPLNFFQGPTRQGKADKFFSIPMVSTRFFKKGFSTTSQFVMEPTFLNTLPSLSNEPPYLFFWYPSQGQAWSFHLKFQQLFKSKKNGP